MDNACRLQAEHGLAHVGCDTVHRAGDRQRTSQHHVSTVVVSRQPPAADTASSLSTLCHVAPVGGPDRKLDSQNGLLVGGVLMRLVQQLPETARRIVGRKNVRGQSGSCVFWLFLSLGLPSAGAQLLSSRCALRLSWYVGGALR